MAGGLAVTQPTSDAWSEMGAQAERALNLGWIPDQRADGAGGFITNISPSSSGLTFISTGDATAYYVTGRTVKVVQAAATLVGTVAYSSVAAGLTSIYLSQIFIAAGLSTSLSTGPITSAAVSPRYPSATDNNTFGGARTVASSSGPYAIAIDSTSVAIPTDGRLRVAGDAIVGNPGVTVNQPGTAIKFAHSNPNYRGGFGTLSGGGQPWMGLHVEHSTQSNILKNDGSGARAFALVARDDLNAGTVDMSFSTAAVAGSSFDPALASPVGLAVRLDIVNSLTTIPFNLKLGTSPASSGVLRIPNSAIAIVSKTSTGGDDIVWPMQFASTTLAASVVPTTLGNTFGIVITKTLAVGTWLISAGITMTDTGAGGQNTMVARLDDGTNVFASQMAPPVAGGSTTVGESFALTAVVSHTTALAYNLSAAALTGSTSFKALALTNGQVTGSTGATWFNAVKIG